MIVLFFFAFVVVVALVRSLSSRFARRAVIIDVTLTIIHVRNPAARSVNATFSLNMRDRARTIAPHLLRRRGRQENSHHLSPLPYLSRYLSLGFYLLMLTTRRDLARTVQATLLLLLLPVVLGDSRWFSVQPRDRSPAAPRTPRFAVTATSKEKWPLPSSAAEASRGSAWLCQAPRDARTLVLLSHYACFLLFRHFSRDRY